MAVSTRKANVIGSDDVSFRVYCSERTAGEVDVLLLNPA
jgi:hypothetical protein